jgi:hypothetical protein
MDLKGVLKIHNRDFRHLSQHLTIPGLVVIRGFINIYPDVNVPARLPRVVSDYPTYRDLTAQSDNKFRVGDNSGAISRVSSNRDAKCGHFYEQRACRELD